MACIHSVKQPQPPTSASPDAPHRMKTRLTTTRPWPLGSARPASPADAARGRLKRSAKYRRGAIDQTAIDFCGICVGCFVFRRHGGLGCIGLFYAGRLFLERKRALNSKPSTRIDFRRRGRLASGKPDVARR